MRILLQTYAFWPSWGGVQKFVLTLYRFLRSSGSRSRIATSSKIVISPDEAYTAWPWTDSKGAQVNRFRFTAECLNSYSAKAQKRRYLSLIKSYLSHFRYCMFLLWFRPQVVHLIYVNVDAWFAIRAKKIFHFKLLTSCRGSDILRFDEQNPYKQMLIRDTLRNSDAITAVSNEIADKIHQILGKDVPVEIIPNGIDPPQSVQKNEVSNSFIFVGRLNDNKNPEFLLKAFSQFHKKHNQYKLTIIGTGPLLNRLIEIVEQENLRDVVEITGEISSEAVPERIRRSIALILPSNYEGSPNVILEAMSVGTPVIGANRSGIKEMINKNDNGLLFEHNDPAALIECMEKLIQSTEFRSRIVENAFTTICKRHNQQTLLKRYSALYAKLTHQQ